MVSSALAITELLRSARRCGSAAEDLAIQLLSRVAFRPIDYRLLLSAGRVAPVKLRSLDAIHVATALALGAGLDVVYSYDRRFLAAAAAHELRTAAPA